MDAITISCASCQHTMRFGHDKAGKKAKCPKCGALVVIAAPEKNGEAAPLPEPAPKVEEKEELGAYGATEVIAAEDRNKVDEKKKPDKKKKKPPKLARKIKALENADEWDKVRAGLIFVFMGVCFWGAAHALQGLYVALGIVDYTEYTRALAEELATRRQPFPERGQFWDVNTLNILLSMIAGGGFLGLAKGCLIIGALLRLAQVAVSLLGYVMCAQVPPRYGTTTAAFTLLGLGGWNLLAVLGLMVLPVLGVYQYYLVPLLTPEVALTEYNMERSLPINVLWMASPFWEGLLNAFIQFLYYLEPVIGCSFIWSIGLSIKEVKLQEQAQSLTQLGLGQFFVLLSFHMISMAGTTPVLVTVLRVLYVLWFAFLLLFILSYAALLLKTREILDAKLHPVNELE
jgi:hypothetical protein